MEYINCHGHTEMSNIRLADSINKIEDYINTARTLGMSGCAITDHESLGGHIRAIKYYKQKIEEDESWKNFKLILGNEIYLCRNDLTGETVQKGEKYFHFILLAKDQEGHHQLRQLSSRAWSHSFNHFMVRVPTYYKDIEEIIGNNPGHIIASSACLGGEIAVRFQNGELEQAKQFIQWCIKIFKDDFYLELQPARYEEQIKYNKWLINLSQELNIKCIITTDCHYLRPEDFTIHQAFLNSKDGDRETEDFYKYTYLMSSEEIINLMNDYVDENIIQEMLQNTIEIGSKIENYDLARPQKVPKINDDRNNINWQDWLNHITIQQKYEYLNKYLNSIQEDDRYILYIALNQLQNMNLPPDRRQEYIDRLEEELTEMWLVSEKLGQPLSSYMLMSRTIVDFIWNECNSIVGISRGSVGCMELAYLIGIIDMDPLTSGERMDPRRFCHRDKVELSDIDTDSEGCKREYILNKLDEKMKKQGGRCIGMATYGTLAPRSTILTLCRGMKIDNDEAQYMASLIGQERGFSYSLTDCLEGNKDKDRRPVKELIDAMNKYPGLRDGCLKLEGLICQMGIHASATAIYNGDINEYSCSMRAPNGTEITQWDLHDAEYSGSLKVDELSIEGADKIHKCLDLLLEDGLIEWQGSLRKTYLKYIHPITLEYLNKDMWKLINQSKVIDLFQMDTQVAKNALRQIKPTSVKELSQINALMRLMPENKGGITPVEEYVYYKTHPEKLKEEIFNLDGDEKKKQALYDFLLPYNGVPSSQESMMYLVMEPEFCNYTFTQSQKVRKIIAKKKMKEIPKLKEDLFAAGRDNGCSEDILNYMWKQISRQLGYSFNQAHCYAYSLIGLQEMNLCFKYNPVYWATACLTINSGGGNEEKSEIVDIYEKEDKENFKYEDLPDRKGKKKIENTDYGKVASAIGRIQAQNIKVELPDINKARFGFSPDAEHNSILYGLKGINGVGDDLANKIVSLRPFSSFDNFIEKVNPAKSEIIALIKAGCFDNLESNITRKELMMKYLSILNPQKSRITLQNINGLITNNLIPKDKIEYIYLYNFSKYLKAFSSNNKLYLDDRAYEYFSKHFDVDILQADEKGSFIPKMIWEKLYSNKMDGLREYFSDNQDQLKKALQEAEINNMWKDSCSGNNSSWEMETLGFYYHEHELTNCSHPEFEFSKFLELPETPEPKNIIKYKDKEIPIYSLTNICGTVIDKNAYKHTLTLLTCEGVISVKFVAEQFSQYDKQISKLNSETGKKEVIDKSWFKRGTKIILSGWRSGDQFQARSRQSENKFACYKIIDIDDFGRLKITRFRSDEV